MRQTFRRAFAALLTGVFFSGGAWAQEAGVWVQIEARPTLNGAQERVRDYASRLENVVGYSLGSGWYAIALGPYSRADAAALLSTLRGRNAIPGDSFLVDGGAFRQQFWPVGVGAPTNPQDLPADLAGTQDTAQADEPAVPEPEPEPQPDPDETPAQARASEAELTRDQRRELQIALEWAGFYNSTIDGLFGRGTRGAMSAWQESKNYEATGILTTRQRAELIADYNSVLDGMDLQLVRDSNTGIEMMLPAGVITFAAYDPPFARFEASGDLPVQLLLISQPGTQDRMFGLYEIMQTLEIVPPEGPRERRNTSFTLEGIGDGIHSYTEVSLQDDEIKGFTLVWPEGDEERRSRVLGIMRESFARIEGVLDPALAPPGEDQAIDLVSGLAIRQPIRERSGFYLNTAGQVLTVAEAVEGCREITLDAAHEATVAHLDADLGIAVLSPTTPLAPVATGVFQSGVPRIQSQIAVAGYPFGNVLSAPALTFGTLSDIRGLGGEDDIKRLAITVQPGDAGGPVFDGGGRVLGMLLPRDTSGGQVLPEDVNFSADSEALLASLTSAGIATEVTDTLTSITPELLTRRAGQVTVLVSCWD